MQSRPTVILRELAQAKVEFILVGGPAAVLHGVPISTQDIDIVFSQDEENISRPLNLRGSIGAVSQHGC
jgi:hypothetical protein